MLAIRCEGWKNLDSLGYVAMFTDVLGAIEEQQEPLETCYDGYVVNAIMDAAYASINSKKWEPISIPV